MAPVGPTFLIGVIILLYLSTFLVFAIIRALTGISIQRVGYFSLRRISYSVSDWVKIEIRTVGLVLHRPTFAQPTWLSIVVDGLHVTVDHTAIPIDAELESEPCGEPQTPISQTRTAESDGASGGQRSRTWDRLTDIKERIKKLHRKVKWLRLVDLVLTGSTATVVDVGRFDIANLTLAVDTRRKVVERARLFRQKKEISPDQEPAEWMFALRGALFTPPGKDPLEIVDHCALNVHGLLVKELDGLRDASIALRIGRLQIPYDDLLTCKQRVDHQRAMQASRRASNASETPFLERSDSIEDLGDIEDEIVQTISDSKEFVSSVLRGIMEVQITVSFIGLYKRITTIKPSGKPLHITLNMKEVGLDMYRLDPRSPAHRMYFRSEDVAHQALLAAISVSLGIEDGKGLSERLIYVPMTTTTIKTTLPTKTFQTGGHSNAAERNANIFFSNTVLTSPSIDLAPKYLPLVLALLHSGQRSSESSNQEGNHRLFSKLLPKAIIKFSIYEPVVRISLPPMENNRPEGDYDLLISSDSSIALEVESFHSTSGELRYSLTSKLTVSDHELYYLTASRTRYNLLLTDTFELDVQVEASPEITVSASGDLRTLSVHMVRPEISEGLRQIVQQLKGGSIPDRTFRKPKSTETTLLRKLPPWLKHVRFEGSNFGVEVAGVDAEISGNTRGVAFQVDTWTAEYKTQARKQQTDHGRSNRSEQHKALRRSSTTSMGDKQQVSSDGRRLAIHVRGLEGYIVESLDKWEPEPFVAVPRFEVAFSTSRDSQGPIFHVHSHIRSISVHYSLYRHYAAGVATIALKRVFAPGKPEHDEDSPPIEESGTDDIDGPMSPAARTTSQRDVVSVSAKVSFLQVKATMPANPAMMLHIYGLEAGRHRWAAPFLQARLTRLYAEAPDLDRVWARLLSLKGSRVDLREMRRQRGNDFVLEKSIDVWAEAIRFAVPHQLILHKVFDNFVNVAKATQQLHHRFKTNTNEYVLDKKPEKPKQVPKISIRTRALLFALEDSSFEWKLGLIYRVGIKEQKARLAREEAFRMKVKKLEEPQKSQGGLRAQSEQRNARGRSRARSHGISASRSRSEDNRKSPSSTRKTDRGRKMRYDPSGTCGLSGSCKVAFQDAWYRLQEHNAQSWKRRIKVGMRFQQNSMKELRRMFWGVDHMPDNVREEENILEIPNRPGLMSALISDLHVIIDKPSFPLKDCARFLHSIGKGMPNDMKYSLLIPMNIQIDMGEARVNLRDYPLPLLHVPAMRPGQSSRLPSWTLKTDFVIAEEYRDSESTRHVKVDIVPPENPSSRTHKGGFAIDVRRTVSPVKTYSDVQVDINTSYPTRITWGTSYQPAIQDMMMVIESFTKPQVDPSDRTGFWDKIRLVAHSRVNVHWKGDGDVQLSLKGSRDPYVVTGHGAGFLMCWRGDVRWDIHRDDDPRKFMTVKSAEYILAVPDYSHQARQSLEAVDDDDTVSTTSSSKSGALFKKVIMKLSGNVQWLAGLMFERDLDDGGRSFNFMPHYDIILKNPEHAVASKGKDYDAFRGFRSHHIHLSVAIIAPVDRDWSVTNLKPASSYNTVHLSPRFFTHFFNWWSMFSGAMSLPIRQGKLWPGPDKSSKKFGRHLATIKYNLLLSPLFISHIYKHKDPEDYNDNVVSATGLKVRLDSFMLDLHQRREHFPSPGRGRKFQTKTSGMRINEAQVDFITADIRAVSATIKGTTFEDVQAANGETLASYQSSLPSADISRFTIPDNDLSWIDMDDFVELDWILPAESNPETKIMPLAFAPRFTYFRQTDHGDNVSGDTNRSSPFGNEPTHYCVMSKDNDPRRVQVDLIRDRLKNLDDQVTYNQKLVGELEVKLVKTDYKDATLNEQYEALKRQVFVLKHERQFLQNMLSRLIKGLASDGLGPVPDPEEDSDSTESRPGMHDPRDSLESSPLADYASDFNNRFIVHNIHLKWNNSLRNIILRYIHQVSQRRGFVYYMSQRAVKFILDIVEEQNRAKAKEDGKGTSSTNAKSRDASGSAHQRYSVSLGEEDPDISVEDRIQQLLEDGKKFVKADDPETYHNLPKEAANQDPGENISENFTPQNVYHVRLVAPQIQLQSEKNSKAAVLLTAKGMQLKVVQIMDKDRVFDDVSGLVQRRFSADMDSVQFFVTNQKIFTTQFPQLYSGFRYGTPPGSYWPPWVPLEVIFDSQLDPFGFSRVVQKTSASLRYDKYNTLRLKYNDEVTEAVTGSHETLENPESRIDHIWVNFPQVRAICNSSEYYAIYIIVYDLLLYSEPLEKVRNERLEKIMLASDFSDLSGAPQMIKRLQDRIRQLEEIKNHFQVNSKYLDNQGWEDRLSIEEDLANCEDELFFMMKAITTSQRRYDERSQGQESGFLRYYVSAAEIVWHLMKEKNQPLMEFQLGNASYDRTENNDGSNYNTVEVESICGLNLLPHALYPEMIAPYHDPARSYDSRDRKMFQVHWYMLEAIAGIAVLENFEVNLHPLMIQLEREISKEFFEYIFPGVGSKAFETSSITSLKSKHMEPLRDEDEDEDDDSKADIPLTQQDSGDTAIIEDNDQTSNLGTSPLELRLKPTLTLSREDRTGTFSKTKAASPQSNGHHWRLFAGSSRRSRSTSRPASIRTPSTKSSNENLRITPRTNTGGSSLSITSGNSKGDRPKRFLQRTTSEGSDNKDKPSDDLTQMVNRASNYMTLAYVKIPSVVLCLSYKGRGERNIEDLHNFVFRLPTLEYRNKTWSYLDLALHLKRDVIKALISHTGAIIGNKIAHHSRPGKQQQSRLRELIQSSTILPSSDSLSYPSETSSTQASSPAIGPVQGSSSNGRPASLREPPLSRWSSFDSTRPRTGLSSVTPSVVESLHEGSGDDNHGSIHNSIGRRLSIISQKVLHNDDSGPEETEESHRRKSKLLLGRKFLSSLNS